MSLYHKLGMGKNKGGLWFNYNKKDWDVIIPRVCNLMELPVKTSPRRLKLLDVGFGSGNFISYFKKNYNLDIYGIDKSNEIVLDYVKSTNSDSNKFKQSTLPNLPFGPNSFDRIICYGVIIYLSDEKQCQSLNKMISLLKPNGILLIGGHVMWNYKYLNKWKDVKLCLQNQKFNSVRITYIPEKDIFGKEISKKYYQSNIIKIEKV
jgi:ubiquinone/menaquinone biosynthesis C-methylase UbiE